MKGVILAGGLGTRLRPLTHITNKALLPVYDKPMILYPLDTLRNSGIKEIMIVCGPDHSGHFIDFLGSGEQYGVNLAYAVQTKANGISAALALAEDFADNDYIAVTFGDNIFEHNFSKDILKCEQDRCGAMVFLKKVHDSHRFGVPEIRNGEIIKIEEKPKKPKSDYAVTGFYIYDNTVFKKIKKLKPSARGELEVTDLNNLYIKEGTLAWAEIKGNWFDVGTFDSLLTAANWAAKKN